MRFRVYIISFVIFLPLCAGMNAQSRQKLEEQRKRTLKEITEINSLLQETRQNQKESLEKITLLNNQITQYGQLIDNIGKEIHYAEQQIRETTLQMRKQNAEAERLKAEYAQMVFHAYKNRGRYNKLVYILSSRDFNEAYRRMKYFQQYGKFRQQQVIEIQESRKRLQETILTLAEQKAEKEKLLTEQQQESKRLETVKTEQNKEIQRLKSQESKWRTQIAAKEKEAQKLQKEIDRMIAEEVRKSRGDAKNMYDKLTPQERLMSDNFKDNKGLLPWPTERGIVTGFFGTNPHHLYKDIKINNSGVDITTVGNASVRTVFEGVVSRVARINGENITILIRHGNYITVYMNLVDIAVKQGDKVKSKETIGKVYTEKGAKTAILHFEIWEETNKLNPELWMMKR
ncbi:MAG: peptidoglycan DD-metalloendopeptidase family protein [Bacteroidales bacterium]|jgi:septal ring factor EnvC (AmiA/AmiB activator)|nr:peptidoglycan DD-metalloendopeptidase family protein [Bacteroidales bacterium]